jgi:hypothetical protein
MPMTKNPLLLCGVVLAGAACAAAEVTRTVEITLSGEPAAAFAIENLAGTMKVTVGDTAAVEVVATVHAENATLADAVVLKQVRGKEGVPTLRLIYPLSGWRAIRYPGAGGSSTVEYDGHKVRVRRDSGDEVWADVVVRVPRKEIDGTFRNLVGSLDAEGLQGTVLLDAASGDIAARDVSGRVTGDTGSGEVDVVGAKGSFTCDTGSGDCLVADFDGEQLKCDTGSGDVRIRGARAARIVADTGSGDVRVTGADVEDFRGDTGSGRIELENAGSRLRRIWADTGSGSVVLRLPADVSFDLRTDIGSGDIVSRFKDAEAVVHRREVVGYRRGDGGVRIDVDTGSGDVVVEPIR